VAPTISKALRYFKPSETSHPTTFHHLLKGVRPQKILTVHRQWAEIKPGTDLAKYTRTNTTAVQMSTLSTPRAKCLTAVISTYKIPNSIESFAVLTYQHTQVLMEGHSEGGNRRAANVTIADSAVQSQIHHHLRICTKGTLQLTTLLPKAFLSNISGCQKF
jgi:hypothetical protein